MMLAGFAGLMSMDAPAAQNKPKILVIRGDEVGTWNINRTRGMMGDSTPCIDRIAREDNAFTDEYDQLFGPRGVIQLKADEQGGH
jgi:hypothetical protein